MPLYVPVNNVELEFPDGTPPEKIDAEVNAYLAKNSEAKTTVMGAVSSAAAGINSGVLDLVDLPSDFINMVYRETRRKAGDEHVQMDDKLVANISDVLNLVKVRGEGVADAATRNPADTGMEQFLNKAGYITGGGVGGAGAVKVLATKADDVARLTKGMMVDQPSWGTNIATNPNFLKSEAIAATGAAVGGASANALFPDSMLAELAGTLTGGILAAPPAAVAAGASKLKEAIFDPFTDKGIKTRVSRQLRAYTSDPSAAIDRIDENYELLTRVFPDTHIPTTVLANDPGLSSAFFKMDADNPVLLGILNDFDSKVDDALLTAIERNKVGPATGADLVGAVGRKVGAVTRVMDDRITALKTKSDEMLAGLQSGRFSDETSVAFREGVENMYLQFKKTEERLWNAIPEAKNVNFSPLQTAVNKYKATLSKAKMTQMDGDVTRLIDNIGSADEKLVVGKDGAFQWVKGKSTGDMQELLDVRSILLEKARIARANGSATQANMLSEIETRVSEFINDPGIPVGEAYRRAADLTRRKHEAFTQGSIGAVRGYSKTGDLSSPPESTLSYLTPPGDVGASRGKDILRSSAGDAIEEIPTNQSLVTLTEQYIGDKYSGMATGTKRSNFLKSYAPLLRQFPSLNRTLNQVNEQVTKLADDAARLEGRRATLSDKNKFYAASLLDTDPANVPRVLMNMPEPDLRKLMVLFAREPGAIDGARNAFIDHLQSMMMNSKGAVGGVHLDAILKQDPKLRRVFNNLLTDDQRINIMEVNKAIKALAPPSIRGATPNVSEGLKNSSLNRLTARVMGARAGAAVANGHNTLIAANAGAGFVEGIANRITERKSRAIITQAMQDRKLLKELLRPVNNELDARRVNDKLRGYLITLGYAEEDE